MKKIFIMAICALLALPVLAQVTTVNIESQKKKIAKSDAELENPKKSENPKTWISRGDLLQELAEENTKGLWVGMSKAEVTIFAGNHQSETTEQKGEVAYEVLVYPTKKLYFENGKLSFWEHTAVAAEGMLFLSKQAYEKAITLDEKGGSAKKIKSGLQKLAVKLRIEGLNAYTVQDFKEAQKYFIASAECSLNPVVGTVDSVMIYYAGVMSVSGEVQDFDNAVKYFNLCLQHNYYENGTVYLQLANAYAGKQDTTQQESTLIAGFTKFPDNQGVLIELINLYLTSGNDPLRVLPFLKQAQDNEPTNPSLFFAEATLYEKLGKKEDAIRMYNRTMEVDPKFYNAYYNLGVLFYNAGVEINKEASEIKDWKDPKIKELQTKANDEFKLGLVEFLKAYELNPNEKAALETIKNLYFSFRNESDEMMKLYNEYNEKWKALNGE